MFPDSFPNYKWTFLSVWKCVCFACIKRPGISRRHVLMFLFLITSVWYLWVLLIFFKKRNWRLLLWLLVPLPSAPSPCILYLQGLPTMPLIFPPRLAFPSASPLCWKLLPPLNLLITNSVLTVLIPLFTLNAAAPSIGATCSSELALLESVNRWRISLAHAHPSSSALLDCKADKAALSVSNRSSQAWTSSSVLRHNEETFPRTQLSSPSYMDKRQQSTLPRIHQKSNFFSTSKTLLSQLYGLETFHSTWDPSRKEFLLEITTARQVRSSTQRAELSQRSEPEVSITRDFVRVTDPHLSITTRVFECVLSHQCAWCLGCRI